MIVLENVFWQMIFALHGLVTGFRCFNREKPPAVWHLPYFGQNICDQSLSISIHFNFTI